MKYSVALYLFFFTSFVLYTQKNYNYLFDLHNRLRSIEDKDLLVQKNKYNHHLSWQNPIQPIIRIECNKYSKKLCGQ